MLLSFVVPTYNRASLVARAIDSVLAQRDRFSHGFEVLVVDDGSTDDTAIVLARYAADPNVRVFEGRTNRGLGHARNRAIEAARGTWCALLDSDNALLPDVATHLEHALLAQPPEVGVLWGDCEDGDGNPTVRHAASGRVSGDAILGNALPGEHFSVIRTSVARACLYPSLGTTHACEPAFWAMVAGKCDVVLERRRFQFYETSGSDRFCALDVRIRRATELATCYEHTASLVRDRAPSYYWELRGKAAFYRTVAGEWGKGVRHALSLVRGLAHHWRNTLVLASCLAGPGPSRWLLRRTTDT